MDILFERTRDQLAQARNTYGNKNQILVSAEELCELAAILTKYGRYDTHEKAITELRGRVMEECGDVLNALDHVQAIFGITDEEMVEEASHKGDRLQKWLHHSKSLEFSTTERDIPKEPCPLCLYNGADPFAAPCFSCKTQPGFKGFTPKRTY